MSVAIKGSQELVTAQKARGKEWAYKAIAASSRQMLFEQALQQAGTTGKQDEAGQAIHSPDEVLSSLSSLSSPSSALPAGSTGMPAKSKIRKAIAKPHGTQPAAAEGVNALATSALLELAALTPNAGTASRGYLNNLATRAAHPVARAGEAAPAVSPTDGASPLGSLSAQFESGAKGAGVIGYDGRGGTSYGTYQIASRVGTMTGFLNYLDDHAPALAQRLRKAGPADTGGRDGGMPREWKQIAAEEPERFARLQHDFIAESHYAPALEEIQERTGLDVSQQPRALQEVLWSTAVQHGAKGAVKIFCKALGQGKNVTGNAAQVRSLVESVYASRARQFGSSSGQVRSAVQGRFAEERTLALAMIANDARLLGREENRTA